MVIEILGVLMVLVLLVVFLLQVRKLIMLHRRQANFKKTGGVVALYGKTEEQQPEPYSLFTRNIANAESATGFYTGVSPTIGVYIPNAKERFYMDDQSRQMSGYIPESGKHD